MGAVIELGVREHRAAGLVETSRRGHLHVVSAPVVPLSPRPSDEILRRRRLVVGAVAAAMLVALGAVLSLAADHVGQIGRPSAQVLEWLDATSSDPAPLVADEQGWVHYQVRPGDSLWSIAERVESSRGPAAIVEELRATRGGSTLRAGETVSLRP